MIWDSDTIQTQLMNIGISDIQKDVINRIEQYIEEATNDQDDITDFDLLDLYFFYSSNDEWRHI